MSNKEGMPFYGENNEPVDYHSHVKHFKEMIMSFKPDSPEFQAFCDLVDRYQSGTAIQKTPRPEGHQLEYHRLQLALIDNDIRKRSNRLPGYKKAFDIFSRKSISLQVAVGKSDKFKNTQNTMSVTADLLEEIKRDAIEIKL